ncbi:MAG: hypothetical protein LC623_09910, partial [Halobacteriales archaeon]|nr:hypothetical protein [Halobacteriales archaeon]
MTTALDVNASQEVGLRLEGVLNSWRQDLMAPLKPSEMTLWLDFLQDLLREAPDLYWIGRQRRGLLLPTFKASCDGDWPRASADAALTIFLENPTAHIGHQHWDWMQLLLRMRLWDAAE